MPGLLAFVVLVAVAVLVIGYAVRPTGRWRRRAIAAIIVVGALAVLRVVSGLITSSAGVAGLEEAQKGAERARLVTQSLTSVAYGVTAQVVVWLVPFVVGEVRRRRAGGR